jgi:hypothetical protein
MMYPFILTREMYNERIKQNALCCIFFEELQRKIVKFYCHLIGNCISGGFSEEAREAKPPL